MRRKTFSPMVKALEPRPVTVTVVSATVPILSDVVSTAAPIPLRATKPSEASPSVVILRSVMSAVLVLPMFAPRMRPNPSESSP